MNEKSFTRSFLFFSFLPFSSLFSFPTFPLSPLVCFLSLPFPRSFLFLPSFFLPFSFPTFPLSSLFYFLSLQFSRSFLFFSLFPSFFFLIRYFSRWFNLFDINVLNSHVIHIFKIRTLIYWLNDYPFICIYHFPTVLYFIKNLSVI